jgi:hypothetical protein
MHFKDSFKIIVAHPDDEILFFNSIITSANRIIVCFGPTSTSEDVTKGRERLKSSYPFSNVKFLDIPESNVFDTRSFKNRKIIREGVEVYKNSLSYSSKFDILKEKLRFELVKGDTVFTHNPWGEYGHPEHVQVFSVISSLTEELNLKVYVNGYVSDKTFELMSRRCSLFSPSSFINNPNNELGQEVKKIYILNNCWTWNYDYRWPCTEIFYKLLDKNEGLFQSHINSSYPPLNVLTEKYTNDKLTSLIKSFIPTKVKFIMKKII